MSNQIVITSGAKVRGLNGVLTGTSGIVSSVPLGAANGVATLDSGGKVPVSQLPSSVVTYLGTWNAATNTPTLVNGVGDAGDMYICNVAGTVNFGAGPVTFAVGDWVLYGSGTWQKSNGQNGTVTSVAVTESGDSLNITGSPITTSGTINIGFNGTNLQYVNGAGNLTTFPTLMTSVGLTMPSAFTVTNSPLTGAGGTLAVTGAGTTAQYIRGDGSLATFPTIASEAQRLITEVYNSTGATLTKGTVVYINGGQGNLPTVTKAIATGDATSAQTYGIVQTDITNNNNGYVVVIGSLTDLDTQAYANGTQLYLSSTTAGAWTSVKQYAPAHLVYVGIVTRSHPTQGVVEVRIQNGFEMDELHNVSAQSPLNNQGLFYNTSTSLWENKSIATALGYTPANDALVVHLAGTETITGAKTFSTVSTFDIGLVLKTGFYPTPATGYVGLGSNGSGITILTKSGSTVYNNNFQFPNASNDYNFPNATGTIALTSDISYPVTSVFGRTGAVVATSGDYTTAQVTESGNLYYTDTRARLALSFVAGSGAYNSTTGVITIPTDNNQIANGAGYITSSALSGYLPLTGGTLTGALGGTSATFSGSVGIGTTSLDTILNVKSNNTSATTMSPLAIFYKNSAKGGALQISSNDSFADIKSTWYSAAANMGLTFTVVPTSGVDTLALTIASTGAATFSSDSVFGDSRTGNNAGGTVVNILGSSNSATSSQLNLTQVWNGNQYPIVLKNIYNPTGGAASSMFTLSTTEFVGSAPLTTERFRIDGNTGATTFTGSVTATSFFESSDSRLKTLIQDNYQTKGIASITPKLYTKNGKVELGYYAQDFVGILDSAVSKGSDDMLSLSYREVLVAKVYALEQRIKELENK